MTTAAAIAAAMVEEVVVTTAAKAVTVAEATAAETERQNSGAGILDIISGRCRMYNSTTWRTVAIFWRLF
jgi:hypothetical protein